MCLALPNQPNHWQREGCWAPTTSHKAGGAVVEAGGRGHMSSWSGGGGGGGRDDDDDDDDDDDEARALTNHQTSPPFKPMHQPPPCNCSAHKELAKATTTPGLVTATNSYPQLIK